MTQFKLKIYNCSRRHHCELVVHNDSIMEIIILVYFFIMFHSAIVHYATQVWYIGKCIYHTNTISFFSIVAKDYHFVSELTQHFLSRQFCSVEECYKCKNNNFGTVKISCSIVALINSKFTKEINETTVGTDDLNLLGWVVLKLDEMSQ